MNNAQEPKLTFKRYEFKYHLSRFDADRLVSSLLKNNMVWDPFVENKEEKDYTVTSLYFDSPDYKCYHEKISGLKNRYKLRLRIYDDYLKDEQNVFLEIKRKTDMVILKDRVILSHEKYKKIFEEGELNFSSLIFSKRDQEVLEEFFYKKSVFNMLPAVFVKYKRKPLIGAFNDRFRITFDSEIKSSGGQGWLEKRDDLIEISPGLVVMEVKFDNTLPKWFLKIIRKYELDRRPFSKYCSAVETCFKKFQL
jgi:SPX domain protein involved in polyphosphate accumulation